MERLSDGFTLHPNIGAHQEYVATMVKEGFNTYTDGDLVELEIDTEIYNWMGLGRRYKGFRVNSDYWPHQVEPWLKENYRGAVKVEIDIIERSEK